MGTTLHQGKMQGEGFVALFIVGPNFRREIFNINVVNELPCYILLAGTIAVQRILRFRKSASENGWSAFFCFVKIDRVQPSRIDFSVNQLFFLHNSSE